MRIFGNEQNYQMIKSLLNNKTDVEIDQKWEKVLGSPRSIDVPVLSNR